MRSLARTPVLVLLGVAAVAWAVTVDRMWGMDEGPATELGSLAWYLGFWVTMMAAMMLPSTVRVARAVVFGVGYLAVWTVFGVAAYAVFSSGMSTELAGALIVAAGVYELTPLKQRSLRRCRDPEVADGPLRSGIAHGLNCVGSSAGLMVALFALGVMSILWTVVVASAIFAEKVLPRGPLLSRGVALGLLVLGLWVAFDAAGVPGLGEPMEMMAP